MFRLCHRSISVVVLEPQPQPNSLYVLWVKNAESYQGSPRAGYVILPRADAPLWRRNRKTHFSEKVGYVVEAGPRAAFEVSQACAREATRHPRAHSNPDTLKSNPRARSHDRRARRLCLQHQRRLPALPQSATGRVSPGEGISDRVVGCPGYETGCAAKAKEKTSPQFTNC
jgi:hypothetical protein